MKNVAEQLLDILENNGVKHIFGVTGDALNYLVEAIEKRKQVRWIGMKHEENAAFAAFAQGELGDVPGVCAGTTGPGALHLINGLYNAKKERSPVLVITGQVPTRSMGTNYFQEADLQKIFDDICEYQAVIRSPKQSPRVIQRAIKIALSRGAVCRIELPGDIAEMKAEHSEYIHPIQLSDARLVPGDGSMAKAVQALNQAGNVSILAGVGCRECSGEVLELARKLKAPVIHSLKASDIFWEETDYVIGATGLIGNPSGYDAVMKCDLLLMLGTDFPYNEFLPHHTQTIQVDTREENIGNRTAVEIGVHGDVKAFLNKALPKITQKSEEPFLTKHRDGFAKWRKAMKTEASPDRKKEPLHPQIFFDKIDTHASDDAIFTIETGTAAIWASHHLNYYGNRRLIGSFNHGSMAVGLPAAMGAQLQYPEREVWSLSGDGAFNMVMQDFITAVRYELPIKVLILNNSELSFVKLEMEEAGLVPSLEALKQVNLPFADYARLCGGEGVRVEKAEDIEGAILEAKQSRKPFIIDAVVNSGELSLPPHVRLSQAVHFGTSKIKEGFQALSGNKEQLNNLKKEMRAYFDR